MNERVSKYRKYLAIIIMKMAANDRSIENTKYKTITSNMWIALKKSNVQMKLKQHDKRSKQNTSF